MDDARDKNDNRFRIGYVLSLAFAHFLHDTYSSFLSPVLPLIIKNLGISLTLAAMLSVFQRAPSLLNPFIGIFADRLPLLYFIVISPVITAVTMSFLPMATSYPVLVLLLLTMGLSAAFFHVPAPVLMKNTSGKRIGTGMSFFMLGGEFARSVGPIVILGAISLWGLKGTYRLSFFALIFAMLLFFVLKSAPGSISGRKGEYGNRDAAGAFSTIPLLIKRHKKLFMIISGVSFSKAVIASALTAFLPTYLTYRGSNLWFSGIALSVLEFAGALGTLFSGFYSDRIGRKRMLLISITLSPIFMFFFLISGGLYKIIFLVLIGLSVFSVPPVLMALVQDSEKEYPASANGFYMTFNFVINSITILMVGFLGDKIGLNSTYWVTLILSLVGIPFVMFLNESSGE